MHSETFESVCATDSVGDAINACTSEGVGNNDHANTLAQSTERVKAKVDARVGVALNNQRKEKHFLVTKVFEPEIEGQAIVEIELEAAMTGRKFCMAWQELKDREHWHQGWL